MTKQEMMDKINQAREIGVPLSERLSSAMDDLECPHYTITLTGEFQVGKSTLLNQVILGSDVLLTEGVGMPTTAIPCKIVYAPTKELTVVYRDATKAQAHYFGDSITDDLLRSLTTASDENARIELSKQIRYVQLGLPVEAIRNYTFFDTPGVNDPNVELIERTTAETLPTSDMVLLIVDASRALTNHAIAYLRKAVFAAGMSRVMVLASYKPQIYMRPEARKLVLDNIKAQLKQIDRGYVPVLSYTYDPDVEGDILRGPKEIMNAILGFVAENREVAKVDKATYLLSSDVGRYVEELKASVEVSGKGEEEIAELNRKIDTVARSLDAQYNKSVNEFALDSAELNKQTDEKLRAVLLDESSIDSAYNLFLNQFAGMSDPVQIKGHIDSAVNAVAPIVQARMVEISAEYGAELRNVMMRANDKAVEASNSISISTTFTPSLSEGWAGRINPKLLKALEVGGVVLFAGPIFGVVTYFLDRIPIIKNYLPHGILGKMILNSLKQSFKDALTVTHQNMLTQMTQATASVQQSIRELYQGVFNEKIVPYKEAIAAGRGKVLDAEAVKRTRELVATLNTFNESLSA